MTPDQLDEIIAYAAQIRRDPKVNKQTKKLCETILHLDYFRINHLKLTAKVADLTASNKTYSRWNEEANKEIYKLRSRILQLREGIG